MLAVFSIIGGKSLKKQAAQTVSTTENIIKGKHKEK
jgi:hypothetical protein